MPEVFQVNSGVSVETGQHSVVINCIDAGFSAGIVIISPTDNRADGGALTLAPDSWTDDYVTVTLPPTSLAFEFSFWFLVDVDGFANLLGFPVQILPGGISPPVLTFAGFPRPPTGLNYQGRDGELHFLDNSQATAGVRATPWGIAVRFAQMDLTVIYPPRPPEVPRTSRQRLTGDSHFVVGSEDNLMVPTPVVISFAISSQETDAVPQFLGLDWMHQATASPADAVMPWAVKGTPEVGLVSTKGRKLTGDGLYAGGIIDGKGSLIMLPAFSDAKKVAVDMEAIWMERTRENPFGYRLKEVYFDPDKQKIVESPDFVIVGLLGWVYGGLQRISQFSRALDVLSTERLA